MNINQFRFLSDSNNFYYIVILSYPLTTLQLPTKCKGVTH